MELSNKTEYVILALLALAKCYTDGEALQIREIASRQNIPSRYLEELLATLRRGGLIKSIRGVKGGYVLAREPHKITVLDALLCIEGLDDVESAKSSTVKKVEIDVIQDTWQEVRQAAYEVLQKYTLQDLCDRRITKQQMDLMYYI